MYIVPPCTKWRYTISYFIVISTFTPFTIRMLPIVYNSNSNATYCLKVAYDWPTFARRIHRTIDRINCANDVDTKGVKFSGVSIKIEPGLTLN